MRLFYSSLKDDGHILCKVRFANNLLEQLKYNCYKVVGFASRGQTGAAFQIEAGCIKFPEFLCSRSISQEVLGVKGTVLSGH